ncbi:hypothetical protein [Aquimarina spinulae]|uniref:hypothetical protein n=1 Tax=Aquimarina spinulae TaxID=1192023 RepID=UPI000D558226|nr:hypothetical protein [Aquimarina spinulae]
MDSKEIRVNYLYGIDRNDFLDLKIFGFETEIPKKKEQMPIYALGTKPEDFIILFGIYFSLKVTEELAKGAAEKLTTNFTKTIKKIWKKYRDSKPAKLVSGQEPEYKLPKAVLTFQISKDETTKLEITNEISESDLEKILETQLELVKMKYKHRKAELKLNRKGKK